MQSFRSNKGAGQGVLAIIAIICIAIAGYFIFKQAGTKKEEPFANSYYYCTNCEKEFMDSSHKIPPIKCPYCKQVTAANLRKYKCKQCGTVFPGYIEKFDLETKRIIERKKRGENVHGAQIGSMLMSEVGEDNWVDASSQEAYDILNNIACPKCQASGVDIVPVFPKPKKK